MYSKQGMGSNTTLPLNWRSSLLQRAIMCSNQSIKYSCPRCGTLVHLVHKPEPCGRCPLYDRLGLTRKKDCPEWEGVVWSRSKTVCRRCHKNKPRPDQRCRIL